MSASKQLITSTEDYDDLSLIAEAWASGLIDNLWLSGYPGSGKTTAVKQALRDVPRVEFVTGHMTPKRLFELMCEWNNRGVKLVVFDDVQAVTRSVAMSALLKQAMSGETVKYNTTQKMEKSTIEVDYRFCVITNDSGTPNEHISALQSRSVCIEHTPNFDDTLSFAREREIINEDIYRYLNHVGCPSQGYVDLRTLSKLSTLARLGLDWKKQYDEYI